MKKTTSQHTPQVGNKKNSGKYFGIAVLGIVIVVIAHGFFSHSKKPETTAKDAELVNVADNAGVAPLNLSIALPPAAAQPTKIVTPPPPPPSILKPVMRMNMSTDIVNDDSRLRAPTQIYSYDNSTQAQPTIPGGGDANTSFAQQAANATVVTVAAKQDTDMDYKILQGKFVSAALETSINSDMPGMARAVVNKDIYSDTGKYILLPRGTRLIGMYNSNITVGQTRVMVVWTRAITPQHLDIALGSPSSDSLGQSGMTGDVDNHFWQTFGSSALLSILGATASTDSTSSNGAMNAYQTGVTQGMMNTSSNLLQSRMNIKPTIHIEQGSNIEVFVVRDLDFSKLMSSNS